MSRKDKIKINKSFVFVLVIIFILIGGFSSCYIIYKKNRAYFSILKTWLPDIDNKVAELEDKINNGMEELKGEINKLKDDLGDTDNRLNNIESKAKEKTDEINGLKDDIKNTEQELQQMEGELDEKAKVIENNLQIDLELTKDEFRKLRSSMEGQTAGIKYDIDVLQESLWFLEKDTWRTYTEEDNVYEIKYPLGCSKQFRENRIVLDKDRIGDDFRLYTTLKRPSWESSLDIHIYKIPNSENSNILDIFNILHSKEDNFQAEEYEEVILNGERFFKITKDRYYIGYIKNKNGYYYELSYIYNNNDVLESRAEAIIDTFRFIEDGR